MLVFPQLGRALSPKAPFTGRLGETAPPKTEGSQNVVGSPYEKLQSRRMRTKAHILDSLILARNPKIVSLFSLCALAVGVAQAQPQDAAEFQRASTTHRLAEFPKIHKDGRVWFQFKAPNAQKIQLRIGATNKTYDMEKLADGTWNLVIPYPGPGLQYYTLIVDGLTVMDPGSETFYSNGIKTAVEVPSPGEDFYELKDVPHGHVLQHVFYSKVTQSWRRMYIYLPPGYDSDSRSRYPVLYLQHGAGEDETEWTHAGRAQFILDNLIAAKKAVPMLIVMNNGFATAPSAASTTGRGATTSRFAAFEETLVKEAIPEIDTNFRTIADRDHRALAGLSMGGMQTFQIGTTHLDLFSYLGIFSGTPMAQAQAQVDAVAAQGAAFRDKVRLLWFGVGTTEANFYNRTKEVRAQLEKAGIPSGYYESPGTAHEFQTWRRCLREFAPLLFQPAGSPSEKK
jgi:enterochelin esterase-like enzyme